MKNAEGPILVNGNMSSTIVSNLVPLPQRGGVTITAEWTGTPVGIILLQLSTEEDRDSIFGANVSSASWQDYEDTDYTVNGAGKMAWIEPWPFHRWLRIIYRATSGTGVLNARFNGKSV